MNSAKELCLHTLKCAMLEWILSANQVTHTPNWEVISMPQPFSGKIKKRYIAYKIINPLESNFSQ